MLSVEVTGLFSLIILVLDVMAIIKTVQSRASTTTKVVWVVAILLLPVLGLVLWFLFGPRR